MYRILPLALIFFAGCTLPWQNSPIQQSQIKPQIHQPSLQKQKIQTPVKNPKSTGYIKGVIQSVELDKMQGLWIYEVAGSDTKNGKLSHAIFTHTQSLYDPGVLIYAQIKDGKLVQMYRISGNQLLPSFTSNPNPPAIKKEPTQKRTKGRQKIAPPKAETIELD